MQRKILMTRFPYESQLSGEEWHTINLAEQLRMRGNEVFFMGSDPILLEELSKRGFTTFKKWGSKPPVTTFRLIIFTLFLFQWVMLNLWIGLLYIKFSKRIDTLYCLSFTEKLLLTPLGLLLGMKVIWMEHARLGRWFFKNPWTLVYMLWARWVEVVFVSEMSTTPLGLKFLKNKEVITNGIDLSHFEPLPPGSIPSRSIFTGHKIPQTAEVVGTVARLSKDKGLDYFIKAAAEVLKTQPTIHFVIAGKGEEHENLKALIAKLGLNDSIHLLGEMTRKQIVNLYQLLEIVVLPSSEHDPFGLVAAEAAAMRKPLIVTDVCGIASELTHKKDAIIIPAKDEKALATSITHLLAHIDLKDSIAAAAYETAHAKFSLKAMAQKYEELINRP
jgi:glycosyltransferase involved in cell wall biosynthesis